MSSIEAAMDTAARRNARAALTPDLSASTARGAGDGPDDEAFQLATEAADHGVWDWRIASGEIRFSRKNWQLLGYAREAWPDVFESWRTRVHPDDLDAVLAAIDAHLTRRERYDVRYRMRAADGTWRWWRSLGQASWAADGAPQRMIGTNTDITELVSATQQSRELVAYQQALDLQAIVSVARRDGVITFANANFCRISGYELHELTGQTHRIVNSGRHPAAFFREMWRTIAAGHTWHGEICNRSKSGHLYWVDTTIVPVPGDDGRPDHYVSIRYDITEKKALEASLKADRDRLEDLVCERTKEVSQKNQQLREALQAEVESSRRQKRLVSLVSHELRTPLSIIDALAGRLKRRRAKMAGEKIDKALEKIQVSVTRLVRLMESTLTASKISAGSIDFKPAPVAIQDQLAEIVAERRAIAPHADLSLDVERCAETIVADQTLIYTLVDNLVSNAIKFSGNASIVKLAAFVDGDRLMITVADNGVGIPDEEHHKIGQAHFRASTAAGAVGTGIGLSVANEIAAMHGGDLAFDSVVGEGTTFTLRLPLNAPANQGGR